MGPHLPEELLVEHMEPVLAFNLDLAQHLWDYDTMRDIWGKAFKEFKC